MPGRWFKTRPEAPSSAISAGHSPARPALQPIHEVVLVSTNPSGACIVAIRTLKFDLDGHGEKNGCNERGPQACYDGTVVDPAANILRGENAVRLLQPAPGPPHALA